MLLKKLSKRKNLDGIFCKFCYMYIRREICEKHEKARTHHWNRNEKIKDQEQIYLLLSPVI